MGGAVHMEGNISPVAEFNTYADAVAAAQVFALTSTAPRVTMPPRAVRAGVSLPDYPENLSSTLKLTLFPVDITTVHCLDKERFQSQVRPLIDAGSPLAQWVFHFLARSFEHIEAIETDGETVGYALHDPLTIWYLLTRDQSGWKSTPEPEDIRIETTGQWTRRMHVIDRRKMKKVTQSDTLASGVEVADNGSWLSSYGNQVNRIVDSPG